MNFLIYKDHKIPAELAITAEEQAKGLMHRKELPAAMAFPYPGPRHNSFWMNNVSQPLDIVFCRAGSVVAICQGEPFSTKLVGGVESDLVLEFPSGQAKTLGMRVGDPVRLEYSAESKTEMLLSASLGR